MESIGNQCISAYSTPSHTCNTLVMKLRLNLWKSILQLTHIVYIGEQTYIQCGYYWPAALSHRHNALMATDLSLVFPLSLLMVSEGRTAAWTGVLPYKSASISQRLRHTHTDTRSITRWFQIQTSAANSFLFSCNYEGQFGSRLSSHIDRRSLIHT